MNLALQLTQQTNSCSVFNVTDVGDQQQILVACCRTTGRLKQRAFGEWVDLNNAQLQSLIQQTIGLAPVTTHEVIKLLSSCEHTRTIATIQALIAHLPKSQQPAVQAIAEHRLDEIEGTLVAYLAPLDDNAETAKFEEYAKRNRLSVSKHPYPSYICDETYAAWCAWSHRAQLSIPKSSLTDEQILFELYATEQKLNLGKFLSSFFYGNNRAAAAWNAWKTRAGFVSENGTSI